jgi:hypothetical protein
MAKTNDNKTDNDINGNDPYAEEKAKIALEELKEKLRNTKASADKAQAEADKAAAEAEKAYVDADKSKVEAEKAKYKAIKEKWNISETKGLKGKINVGDGAGYKAELLAYDVIDSIAKKISEIVSAKVTTDKLIILGQDDLSEQVAFWSMIGLKLDIAISYIENSIEMFRPKDPSIPAVKLKPSGKTLELEEVFIAAPAILGAAADIAAFFKTNYSITSREITINEKALKAAVRHFLNRDELTVFFPEYSLSPQGKLHNKVTILTSKIEELTKIRFEILSIPKKDFTQLLDSTTSVKEEILKEIDEQLVAVEALISTLTTKSENTLSPFESVATVDFASEHPEAEFLHLAIVSHEGEVVISESTFQQSRIVYLGGAVVCYFLCDINGKCMDSGTLQETASATYRRKKGKLKEMEN